MFSYFNLKIYLPSLSRGYCLYNVCKVLWIEHVSKFDAKSVRTLVNRPKVKAIALDFRRTEHSDVPNTLLGRRVWFP